MPRRYTTSVTRRCPHCHEIRNAKGYTQHFRACARKTQARERDRRAVEAVKQALQQAEQMEQALKLFPGSHEDLSEIDLFGEFIGTYVPESGPYDSEDGVSRMFAPTSESGSDSESYGLEESEDAPAGDNDDLQHRKLDDIKVEYHPNSGRQPRIFRFEKFQREWSKFEYVNDRPWRPFKSRDDFEFSDAIVESGMKKEHVKVILDIMRRISEGCSDFSLFSYEDLSRTWAKAERQHPSFEKHTIEVPYMKEVRSYDVHTRDLREWIIDQVSSPLLANRFQWDAQRMFKWDGERWEQYVDEPFTAKQIWTIQSTLPKGTFPLGLVFYTDKAKLSTFGTQQCYPLIVRIANLDSEVRNGNGFGGGRIVAFLPVVPENASDSSKTSFANFRRRVIHEAIMKVLETIIDESFTGLAVDCGDGIRRILYLFILIISADYEEQCTLALIRGLNSAFPCPVCLVSGETLSDISQEAPLRSSSGARELLLRTYSSAAEREEALKAFSLRPVFNVFWLLNNTDPYAAMTFDPLHAYHSGLWGRHLWKEMKKFIENLSGRDASVELDAGVMSMSRWRGLTYFNQGAYCVDFNDGSKFQDLSKIIVFAAYNIFPARTHRKGYTLLRLIRKYVVCDMWLNFDVHTETTLEAARKALLEFNWILEEYQGIDSSMIQDKDWNFIKAHSHMHAPDDIWLKGVLKHSSTKRSESLHGPTRKSYQRHCNGKDVMTQLGNLDHRKFCSMVIRETVTASDKAAAEALADGDDSQEESAGEFWFGQVYLGARQSRQGGTTIAQIGSANWNDGRDPAYKDFRLRLNRSLTQFVNDLKTSDQNSDGKWDTVRLTDADKIMECRFLKIEYESMVTWRTETDLLRCNPSFGGKPRYDAILYNDYDTGKLRAGILIFMFVYKHAKYRFPVALVQPADRRATGPSRNVDADLGFYRVRLRPRNESVFIPLRCATRGALLFHDPDPSRIDEYLVVDTVDADMFLRLRTHFS